MQRKLFQILMVACLSCHMAANAETVTMMTATWSPYVDKQLPEQGVSIEIMTHVFAAAGYEVDNTITAWPRAMEGVAVGLYDVLGGAWKDRERELDFIYSEPFLVNELIVVKRRSMPGNFDSVQALEGGNIGLITDYSYGVDFTALPNTKLVYENHMIQSLMNLLNNKVDFVVGDRRVIALMLTEYLAGRRGEVEVVPIALPSRSLYVAGSRAKKGAADLIKAFNKALFDSKTDGSYDKILAKWRARYAAE